MIVEIIRRFTNPQMERKYIQISVEALSVVLRPLRDIVTHLRVCFEQQREKVNAFLIAFLYP